MDGAEHPHTGTIERDDRTEGDAVTHLVLVLGCHRSGTSLITKSMECLGVSLGKNADWSGPDNVSGFWENKSVLWMNENLLWRQHCQWDDLKLWAPLVENLSFIRGDIAATVRNEIAGATLFGIKEPRLCRLLPYWRPIFKQVADKVSVVYAVRHPMSVAKSLNKRNSIPIDHGLALWLEYTRRARADADPAWPSVTVRYECMMVTPVEEIARISKALKLPYDHDAAVRFETEFCRDDLWHETAAGEALPEDVHKEWELVGELALT